MRGQNNQLTVVHTTWMWCDDKKKSPAPAPQNVCARAFLPESLETHFIQLTLLRHTAHTTWDTAERTASSPAGHGFSTASSLPQNYWEMCTICESVQYSNQCNIPTQPSSNIWTCAISPWTCPLPPLSQDRYSTSLFTYLLTSALSFFMLITCSCT